MIFTTQISYSSLCEQCFIFLPKPLNKWRRDFIIEVLWLFLSIKGRINFLQLKRHGSFCEQRYRQHFEAKFEFFDFNSAMVKLHCSTRRAIAFDPSYIPKSGKKTDGVGWFWSGCAAKAKWGLEISGIATLDLDNHTALHLEAVQTIPEDGESALAFYARIFEERAEKLKKISDIVVADAYFSKEPFVSRLQACGLDVVSRFRDDVRLCYITTNVKTGKRGRPRTKGAEVDLENLNMKHFAIVKQSEEVTLYTAVVHAVALKRLVRIVLAEFVSDAKRTSSKIYFCTNIEMEAEEILEIYQTRFQIEFLYRDAKQYTGLTHCQARNKEKLDFHFNASLTAVNLAKVAHWYSIPIDQRKSFSLSDIKTINHNALLLNQFMTMFAIKPNVLKNIQNVNELLLFGTIAA